MSGALPRRTVLPLVISLLVAQVAVLVPLIGPIVDAGWLQGFRQWAYPDQLSYAAIASNIASGDFSLSEPFTQTGSLFYPAGWYQAMGTLAFLTGLPVHVLWTVMGLAIVCATVLASGWAAWRLSARAWAPLLPALALWTGTLAGAVSGTWYVELLNHAVLWGPLASVFTLNAEIAGICLVSLAMLLVLVTLSRADGRIRPWRFVVAAAVLGLVANVQTYSFFSGLVLATVVTASYALLTWPSRRRLVITLAAVAITLLAGPWLSEVVGRLPVLAILVVAIVIGAWPIARRHPGWSLATVAALVLTASPQLVRTAAGLAGGDPFLAYRTVSSAGLGVAIPTGLAAASVVLLAGLACAMVLWRRAEAAKSAIVIGLAVGLALMSQNDRWGFNQEPYRFWIVFVILSAFLLTPVLAWAFTQMLAMVGWRGAITRAVAGAMAVVWIVSLLDTGLLISVLRSGGVFAMTDGRAVALRDLTADVGDDLVLGSRCLPPQVFKNIVGHRVAHYNKGLAWPDDERGLRPFIEPYGRPGDDVALLQGADIGYVVTDAACADDWSWPAGSGVVAVGSASYAGADGATGTVILWRVPG